MDLHITGLGCVVAGVVPATASLAEEQDARDQCQNDAGTSDEESPEEHGLVAVEADLVVLVHESSVYTDPNTNADS